MLSSVIDLSVCLSGFFFFVFLLCGKEKGKEEARDSRFWWMNWLDSRDNVTYHFFLFYLPTYLPHCCCCQSRCPPRSIVWNFFSICLSIYLPTYLSIYYVLCMYLSSLTSHNLSFVVICVIFLSVVLLLLLLLLPLNAPGAPTTTSHVRPWSRLVVRTVHTQSTCMHTSHSVSCKP